MLIQKKKEHTFAIFTVNMLNGSVLRSVLNHWHDRILSGN